MIIKQISIFIENRKGRLAEVTDIIAKNGVNIRALSLADTTNFGVLRTIVDDTDKVEKVLKANNMTVSVNDVFSVCIADKPGGLSGVLALLNENDIQIEYMYAFISKESDKAYVVMRIDEKEKAREILERYERNALS